MKWIRYISILIMIYIVCTARTCNGGEEIAARREEQYTKNLKDSIRDVFMTDSINDQFLRAYEASAVQKLEDFADYLKIVSDTALEMRFRQHAAELVKGLFIIDKIEFNYLSRICPESDINTLELLLSHSLSENISCPVNPLQITVSKPFIFRNDSAYIGNLSFINRCVPPGSSATAQTMSASLVIDIFLVKKLRSFGKERIKVWDVYLGDIN